MMSASAASAVRSSLEAMLESLRRRDEALEKAKELPPALPARPTSRARLPSARHSLPTDFKVDANGQMEGEVEIEVKKQEEDTKKKEKELGHSTGSFGSKKMKKDQNCVDSSPYAEEKNEPAKELEISSTPNTEEPEWEDNIGYFIKKFVKVSTADLLPANPDILEGVDDLIKLSYLNEPSVFHNLKCRYSQDMIYSKAGPALIVVNPFKAVPFYGNEIIKAYRQKLMDSPHVYALADTAYNDMMRDEKNQSLVISGESGAGKTETAKHAMKYLATLGGGTGGIEHEILQTNSILEAFGNAKTSRNSNSSRFGKLIEIHFSTEGKICGAKIQTFLLEKSRVVQLAKGERSYHIFYLLCAGAPSILRERLNLKMASEYNYLNQSECLVIDGVDDSLNFHKLMEALDIVQICKADQEEIFALLAAILWLGNISFHVIGDENHVEVLTDEAITNAARLMGSSIQDLTLLLSTHKIRCGKDDIVKKLTWQQAIDRRDALAKFIFASLFDWLVDQINKSLGLEKLHTGRSINILDIYGFESFRNNSFEQFCINYANERLQQHFNRHLFKLEQEDYEVDGIDWTKVDFADNQECLNLFEKVAYDTNGFLEKNRDLLHSDFLQLLSSCNSQLLELFASPLSQSGGLESSTQSVGTKFKGQLFKLMQQLEDTTPHFIRCIKPNTKQLPGVYEDNTVSQQLRCCGVLEVVRISRSGYPTRMTHQDFARRYGFLLLETNASQDPLSISVAVLQQCNVAPEMYQVGYTKVFLRTGQIARLEDQRKQVLQGILGIQKCFRGSHARRDFNKLKQGVTILQSFVRGENARRKYMSMRRSCTVSAPITVDIDNKLLAIVYLQSVIRGWLARKQFNERRKLNPNAKRKLGKKISELKVIPREQIELQTSILADLQRRVTKAEATIVQKEEENAALREQLQQFERRWSEYEAKMKKMEETWQMQMDSLQTSLAAARKSPAPDNTVGQPGKLSDPFATPGCYDSEDNLSSGLRTPGGSTPTKMPSSVHDGRVVVGSETNSPMIGVNVLAREFEQRRQNFDDDAKALNDTKAAQPASDAEFRKLKLRFETWKKEYKARLQETRTRLSKLGNGDIERRTRKWWGKIGAKGLQRSPA
ncbi:hypothetical protein MANES_03G116600v8 [Manihot esculenta]|uniref:Uncharacterized protein n=1 Tax=Manihot esculenta TaxID=3983 RepID=A0ACB7HZ41_MANES|nr:hypothetical protein MANES_03G116600v8 [Manihot esculenta]